VFVRRIRVRFLSRVFLPAAWPIRAYRDLQLADRFHVTEQKLDFTMSGGQRPSIS